MATGRTRADSAADMDRGALYRGAHGRVREAISRGFPLEAVGLLESMICDRLESHITMLTSEPAELSTMHNLITKVKRLDRSPEMDDLAARLDAWRMDRNRIVHEMVKISSLDTGRVTWAGRTRKAKAAAEVGHRLFRDLDKYVRQAPRAPIRRVPHQTAPPACGAQAC